MVTKHLQPGVLHRGVHKEMVVCTPTSGVFASRRDTYRFMAVCMDVIDSPASFKISANAAGLKGRSKYKLLKKFDFTPENVESRKRKKA